MYKILKYIDVLFLRVYIYIYIYIYLVFLLSLVFSTFLPRGWDDSLSFFWSVG
jgi:hypothetical protein